MSNQFGLPMLTEKRGNPNARTDQRMGLVRVQQWRGRAVLAVICVVGVVGLLEEHSVDQSLTFRPVTHLTLD